MSESLFPRTQGDIESAHLANVAYQNGRWLAFAVDGTPTEDQRVLLSGQFDDRALDDLGYDGTVIAQERDLFKPRQILREIDDFMRGDELSDAHQRHADLRARHEFYTSPVVRAPERLSRKVPAEVPNDPSNILWSYSGRADSLAATFGTDTNELYSGAEVRFDGDGHAYFTTTIPIGKRLVIDSIPRGMKNAPDEPPPLMQVHVYPNTNGYLVADKVMHGAALARKRPVATKRDEDRLRIDKDAAPVQQDLYPSNDKKQEFRHPTNPERKKVQLLTTTAQWSPDEAAYARLEVTVVTPDDAGRTITVEFDESDYLPGPILLRLVDDTTEELHPLFQ